MALLPQLVTGLNRLLSLPPTIERRYCDVSQKFQWLMAAACKAVDKLILARHPASLDADALAILHKLSAIRGYSSNNLAEVKTEFSKLVSEWQELNKALFWYEVQKSREILEDKSEKQLTHIWQILVFESFWRFETSDFDYAVEEISHQKVLDDKFVALSLAFDLYRAANRPRAWRMKLKTAVAGNNTLSERLGTYLKPPAIDGDQRRWKQQDRRWKRLDEANRKKQEKRNLDWRRYFSENSEEIIATFRDNPGTITNSFLYLFEQVRNKEQTPFRWTQNNWKALIPEFGEDIARFYRDGTISFWRHHKPRLRSEGAPFNQTTRAVIVGLTGLEIEAEETKDWPKGLNATEVAHACKYASFELNGFPVWFPKLFEMYPKIVCDFLLQEIVYELSIEKPEKETHYAISGVSSTGQWVWDKLAPDICKLLKREPKNLPNLEKLLKILQGSSISDKLIEKLASRKCRTLRKSEHMACWFAVWIGVAPAAAIATLKTQFAEIADPDERTQFAMTFVTHLSGDRRGDGTAVRQECPATIILVG